MKLSDSTLRLLDTLEKNIDAEVEDDFLSQWDKFFKRETDCVIFAPRRKKTVTTDYTYRNININDAIKDKELMLVSELEPCLRHLESGDGMLCVRSNYGTGILPSLFGAEIFHMPYSTNTLPTTKNFGVDKMEELIDGGIPDLCAGFGKDVFDMCEVFLEVFSSYPKIAKYVTIYHPDIQGPLDVCELLIGSDMFYLPYDDPDGFKQMLRLTTDTYKAFLDRWFTLVPRTPERSVHWGLFAHKGNVVIRDDSAMNLTPAMYEEFALPYDAELLEYFDGGVIHFCGRGDHYIEFMSKIPNLWGINMSQPHLNDMEKIYENTVDKGIRILGFDRNYAERDKNRTGGFHRNLSTWN